MTYRFGISVAALYFGLTAAPLAAQQTDSMAHDKEAMMMKDAVAKDGMMEDHGAGAMMPHGNFTGADGHRAKGSYEIATSGGKTLLKLGGDFSVEKGPDVYVVLSQAEKVPAKGSLFLGKLTRVTGPQAFDLPAGTDLAAFTHVVLWCKKYSVPMGVASLRGDGKMMDEMGH